MFGFTGARKFAPFSLGALQARRRLVSVEFCWFMVMFVFPFLIPRSPLYFGKNHIEYAVGMKIQNNPWPLLIGYIMLNSKLYCELNNLCFNRLVHVGKATGNIIVDHARNIRFSCSFSLQLQKCFPMDRRSSWEGPAKPWNPTPSTQIVRLDP